MLGERTESRHRQKEQGANDQDGATEQETESRCVIAQRSQAEWSRFLCPETRGHCDGGYDRQKPADQNDKRCSNIPLHSGRRERFTLSSQSASSEASPEFGHFPVCAEIALRTIAGVWPFRPRPKGEQRIAQGFSPGKPDAQRNRPERASEQGIGLQRNTQENVQTALFARRAMGTCTRKCPNASGRLGPPPLFELRRVREPSKVAP